ncbi:hypothetical protein JOC73_003026 [Alkaliphilus hydrothermalis]|uniref:Uncharacterized protein n=1 Tax=Alkaliphilus hydrothermalis TaxID=1482730 RepID=A0ABS2NU07_9FIRM|nr:hypothetical protein [Alkaliphilus hydrothermalis]
MIKYVSRFIRFMWFFLGYLVVNTYREQLNLSHYIIALIVLSLGDLFLQKKLRS